MTTSGPVVHTTPGDEGMVDRPDARATSAASSSQIDERRRRVALRRLVDEMLDEIRAAANEENWTATSRSQAEADLARIMTQVRREATKRPSPSSDRNSSTAAKRGAKRTAKRTGKKTAKRPTKRSAAAKKSPRKGTKSR